MRDVALISAKSALEYEINQEPRVSTRGYEEWCHIL